MDARFLTAVADPPVAQSSSNGGHRLSDFAPPRQNVRTDLTLRTNAGSVIAWRLENRKERHMNNLIWLVGAVVIILFVLGYFGFR